MPKKAQTKKARVMSSTSGGVQELVQNRTGAAGLVLQKGMIDIYTARHASDVLIFDLTDFITKKRKLLASTSWARGTLTDTQKGASILQPVHLPASDDTMIELALSKDGTTIDVIQPGLSLRTSDNQSWEALKSGAWSGWIDSLPIIETNTSSLFIDATDLLVSGFYTRGWRLADSIASVRVVRVASYEENMLVTVQYMLVDPKTAERAPAEITLSLYQLPEKTMPRRVSDDRLGFFSTSYVDEGVHDSGSKDMSVGSMDSKVSTINRFNLGTAPDRAMRFYVDPTVPMRWRKYFKEGIEAWEPAFAAIGFPNATRAVLPGDSDWPENYDRDDARYSTISWSLDPSEVYAIGLSKVDPRSGQIIKSDIIVMNGWARAWGGDLDFYSRATTRMERQGYRHETLGRKSSASQPSFAGGLPHGSHDEHEAPGDDVVEMRPFELIGLHLADDQREVAVGHGLRSVVMHEVGHTLGLRHNFKGSTGISEMCLRDPSCTKEHGHSVSTMDYLPLNLYGVNNKSLDIFSPVIGAYDKLAIRYGYMQGSEADLQKVLTEAEGMPYCTDEDMDGTDPLCKMHDLGADPLAYRREKLRTNAETKVRLLNMSVLPGESYTKYGSAFTANLYDSFSIGNELTEWLGGLNKTHLHRNFDGEHSFASATQAIRNDDQKKALDMILNMVCTSQPFMPSHTRFLISRTGELGTASINVQDEIDSLRTYLVSKLTSAEIALRIHAVGDIIGGEASKASQPMSFEAYLDRLVSRVWAEKDNWDVKLALVKGLKDLHLQRCEHTMPALVSMSVLSKLDHLFKLAGSLQKDSSTTEAKFMGLIRLELQDYDKPCPPPQVADVATSASYSYGYS
jgi:hypothetical protein